MARTPIWKFIADTLTADIAAGHYHPGEKLPTESALAGRFGVNRHTVRRALGMLANEGLVYSRRGAGTFVSTTPAEYPIGPTVSYTQNLRAAGRLPGKDVWMIESRACDAREADELQLQKGARVHVWEGRSLADGHAIALFRGVFPADHLPLSFRAHLGETMSVTAAFKASGVGAFFRQSTRISAVAADPAQALHLQVREGDPVLRTCSVNVDSAGVPVEFGTSWFAGDKVTLTLSGDEDP